MLFDTAQDPVELRDVAAESPAVVARLRSELWAWMLRDPQMEQQGGFLVPRDAGSLARPAAVAPASVAPALAAPNTLAPSRPASVVPANAPAPAKGGAP
jgi:hypothetical protein